MMRRMHTVRGSAAALLLVVMFGCNVEDRWSATGAERNMVRPVAGGAGAHGIDISVVDAGEVDLVEALVAKRVDYRRSLEQLRQYYHASGYTRKAQWASLEIDDFERGTHFRYLLEAEIASDALRPADPIADADKVYEEALSLLRGGGHGVPLFYRKDRMVQAAKMFRSLIERFPSSDKIDDAAFFLGEIHKEYLPDQEEIAVKWYERAVTWNPQTAHPARFQAAVVYDYRLHDRDKALELYQGVLAHEGDNTSNLRWATRRINELSADDDKRAAQATGP